MHLTHFNTYLKVKEFLQKLLKKHERVSKLFFLLSNIPFYYNTKTLLDHNI